MQEPEIHILSTYDHSIPKQLLHWMQKGYSIQGACGKIGIHRQRIYDWKKKYPELEEALAYGRAGRIAFLEDGLLEAKNSQTVTSRQFALKSANDPDWNETNKHEITGKNGGPIKTESIDLSKLTDQQLEAIKVATDILDKE